MSYTSDNIQLNTTQVNSPAFKKTSCVDVDAQFVTVCSVNTILFDIK